MLMLVFIEIALVVEYLEQMERRVEEKVAKWKYSWYQKRGGGGGGSRAL